MTNISLWGTHAGRGSLLIESGPIYVVNFSLSILLVSGFYLQSPQPRLLKFLRRILNWCQAQLYFQEFPSSVLVNCQCDTANRLCALKPAKVGSQGTSAIQHAKISASYLLSHHFMDSITLMTSISTDRRK